MAGPAGDERALVAGGGIAGLATAIALARHGVATCVLEKRAELAEAGAGIQIGPNGVHVLADLGIRDQLAALAGVPASIRVRQGHTGTELARLPLGSWIVARHGAPYWTLHRHDLHAALLARARSEPLIEVRAGFEVANVAQDRASISVFDGAGRSVRGFALIGADGIGSAVRAHMLGPVAHTFSGKTATRAVVPAGAISSSIEPGDVGLWLSPGAHVVHYPVRGGSEVAVVAIIDEALDVQAWNTPADPAALLDRLEGFEPTLRRALAEAPHWHKWALVDARPLQRWSDGRIALAGDAAHPVLPFLAQGGVLALEDAVVLAEALAGHRSDPAQALAAYAGARRARAKRVQAASRANGRVYHLFGPARLARNAALRLTPGRALMATYDWLYGWRHGAAERNPT